MSADFSVTVPEVYRCIERGYTLLDLQPLPLPQFYVCLSTIAPAGSTKTGPGRTNWGRLFLGIAPVETLKPLMNRQ